MPSTPLRRKLRAAGHALSPIVQIGKEGVTAAVLKQVEQALFDHELIKIKAGADGPEDRFEVAALLSKQPGTQVVQIVGRTVLIYKRHPQQPRYEGAGSRAAKT